MPYSSSIQIVNDANGTAYAFLADNGNLFQGLWNAEAQRWDQGRIVPGAYGARDLQALVVDNLWPSSGSNGAVPGNTPGVVLAYRLGSGASAEVVASFGAWGPDGTLSWSEPAVISSGQGEDSAFALGSGPNGSVQLVLQKRQSSASPQDLLSQISNAPQELINEKLSALASGARSDSDLYLSTLQIRAISGGGYALRQSGNGNSQTTALTPESNQQQPAPAAPATGGNTTLSRSTLATSGAAVSAASAGGLASTSPQANQGLLGATGTAGSPVLFNQAGNSSSQEFGFTRYGKTPKSLASLALVPWRFKMGSRIGSAQRPAAAPSGEMSYIETRSESGSIAELVESEDVEDVAAYGDAARGSQSVLVEGNEFDEVVRLGKRAGSFGGGEPIPMAGISQDAAAQSEPDTGILGYYANPNADATREWLFSGLFGGLLAGRGGYTVANFSSLTKGSLARDSLQRVGDHMRLADGRNGGMLAFDTGTKKGEAISGSLKTIFQYSAASPLAEQMLLDYTAKETIGLDQYYYRTKVYDSGYRRQFDAQVSEYFLLDQHYSSSNGLPEWLRNIGISEGAAGNVLSVISTLGGLGAAGFNSLSSSFSPNLASGFNPIAANGLRSPSDLYSSDLSQRQNWTGAAGNAIGLASAALSVGTVATAFASLKPYGDLSWGTGLQLSGRWRELSKYGVGLELMAGIQGNLLWNFKGIKPIPERQIDIFASVGAALPFGGYIPLLQTSYSRDKGGSTTSSAASSSGATTLATAASSPTSSGSYVSAPTGSRYPMSYGPASASDALLTSAGGPLASLNASLTNLYLYQLQPFAAASLSAGALQWANTGAGHLSNGTYTGVPLIGLSLPRSAPATASFSVSNGSIDPASFSVQLPASQAGQSAPGQYLSLPQPSSGTFAFGLDVFQQLAGNPPAPSAAGASSVHNAMPMFTIDSGASNSPLAAAAIGRITQQISLAGFQQSVNYPNQQAGSSANPNDSAPYTYTNVPVALSNAATNQTITSLNPVSATVKLVSGQIIGVSLDAPLYFANPSQASSCTLVLDLASTLADASIANPSFTVIPQLQGLADFSDQDSYSANPSVNNAGVYLSAGLIDQLPLLASYGHWPVQNRVSYVDGDNVVYLNNTSGSYISSKPVYSSDLTLQSLYSDPNAFQFTAASEPTAITDTNSNTTYVFWVEAPNPVIPLSGSDGEASYQAFMNALYGQQRINYSYATTSQAGTNTSWNYINSADLYSSPGNIITNLRSFSVQIQVNGQLQDRALLVWTEMSISALQNAENAEKAGTTLPGGPLATIHAGLINPNAANSTGGYQWGKLFNDSNGNSTLAEIPWTSDSGSGLTIDDISAAVQLIQVPSGSGSGTESVLTPVLSWSQAVRTPYNEAVLDSQPALFLPLGNLEPGSNAINIGSVTANTETFASSTGLNTAIAGALPKSSASAVQNLQGLGVLATGLGSTTKPIIDQLRNIPQANLGSAQNDPVAIFSGTIAATTLTVSSLSQGSLGVGELLVGPGIAAGTTITAIVTPYTPASGGVYTLSSSNSVASTTTLRSLPNPTPYSYTSFAGSFSGAGGSNGYTTLSVTGLNGSLQIGDRVFGLGLSGGCLIQQVQSFDATTNSGVYTVNQGPQTAGLSYGLAALPGGSSSPYSIEFWTQLAPGSNPAGAGLVTLGQASAAALPDRPAAAPQGWLLSSSFAVERLSAQDALSQGLISSLPSGSSGSDLYGWRWALVADGANTTAMGGNGGANLNRNALVLNNLFVGDRIEGVNTFLANYGLSSADLLGIDGTPADQIAAVPSTQFEFSTDLTNNALVNQQVAATTLNGVAIETSSAVMNGAVVLAANASASLSSMFEALWAFEQKTGQAKVNFSLNPNNQTPLTPSTPPLSQLETYSGLELEFALLPGAAVSVNGSGQIAFDVAAGQTLLSSTGTDLRDSQWHYVVASFQPDYSIYSADGTLVEVASNVGTANLYVDGLLVASVADVVNPYAASNVNDYAQLLSDNAQGAIDLVALYDKALTTSTVPAVASGWPLPTSEDALALMKEAGFVVASKTPNPGTIPGAVSNHWLARNVDPSNALNSTYTATLIPNGNGGGSWNQASALNPLAAQQATSTSASATPAQQDLLIAIQPGDWAKAGWFSGTASTAAAFNPAGQDLKAISVSLTPTAGGSTVSRTLTPAQVLLASNPLGALQPLATANDFNYTFLSNTPALNLLISPKPQNSGDSNNLDSKISYNATVTLSFENGTTVSNTSSSGSSGLALGFSDSLATSLKTSSNTNRKALASAAVVEQAPLQLKYVDSGEIFSSISSSDGSPASSFSTSQVAGYCANSNGSTQNGWLAIAQPRSANAKSDPAGRVWINYTGQFTLNSALKRTAVSDAANAPSTWLNALARSDFNPQSPNLPLLNDTLYQSSVGGLLIKADPSAGWGQNFGSTMLTADVNNDGTLDLIIAAPQANGGGAVVIVDGSWIAANLISSSGQTILDLSNPSNLGSYVTVLTPGTVNSATDICSVAGFGSALAFNSSTNTLWIGAPNYLRSLDSSNSSDSTQPIGALYSYSTSAYAGSWGTANRTILANPLLGSGGSVRTSQAGNSSSTSWWGAQLGTAVAISSSGELAVSAPGVMGSMVYSGSEVANEKFNLGNLNYKSDLPEGLLIKIQVGAAAIDATKGIDSPDLTTISSLSPSQLSSQQKAFLQQLAAQQTSQISPATTQNNQAIQAAPVGAVLLFKSGTNLSGLANTPINAAAVAALQGTTFYGPNPYNTLGDSGFGSSLAFADLLNTNSQNLIVGATHSGGGGMVYTINPGAPGSDNSLGNNQFLAILAATNLFTAAESFDGLGNALVSLGDVNQDGYDDVLLQASNASSGAGNAYLLFGSDQLGDSTANQGLSSLATGSIGSLSLADGSKRTISILSELGSGGALTGQSQGGSADINADGYNDILVGSGSLADAYLTWGHPYLEAISNLQLSKLSSDNGFMLDGLASTIQGSLRSLGDFNGDGYGDFFSLQQGAALTSVRIELGANTQEILADAAYSFYTFTVANGTKVLAAGDINGDGMDDIALFLDQNLSSSAQGNQGGGSSTAILYGRTSTDLPLGAGFGYIAPVDPSSSAPLTNLPGQSANGGLTDAAPAVIAVGNTLYTVVKGVGSSDTSLWFNQSRDGGSSWDSWSNLSSTNSSLNTLAGLGPSLALFNDTLYLAFVNSSGTLSLSSWDPSSSDSLAWTAPVALSTAAGGTASFQSSSAPLLVDRGDSLGVLWVDGGSVMAASSTEPGQSPGDWTTPVTLQSVQNGTATAIASGTTPAFTWLGSTPVLAVNAGGTIQVYVGRAGGSSLQLASSFTAPAGGPAIISAPVLSTTETGLALTYTNADGSISLQRLTVLAANGAPLPGVQFSSEGGVDLSAADLRWQSVTLPASDLGSALPSVPLAVAGNLLLANVRTGSSQIWINAIPNLSDPDSVTWLNSTVQLSDGQGGWSISQQAGDAISAVSPSWSVLSSGQSPAPPAFAEANGVLYAAVQGTNNKIYWTSSSNGGSSWASWQQLPSGMSTDAAPALAVVNGTLYLAYLGNGNSQINITSLTSATNNTWSSQYQIPSQGAKTICMLNEAGSLVIYYQGTNDNLYRTSTTTPASSSGWQENSLQYDNGNSTQTSSGQLAVASLAGTTYLAYQGGTSSSPSNTIYLTSSSSQSTASSWSLVSDIPQANTSAHSGVGLTTLGETLILSYADEVGGSAVLALQQGTVSNNNWRGVPYANLSAAGATTSPQASLVTPSGSSQVLVATINANSSPSRDISTSFTAPQALNQLLTTAQTGSSLSPVGDLNNDGFADLLVAANNVVADTASGLQLTTGLRVINGAANATAIAALNNSSATSQSVQLAAPFSKGSEAPVAAISGGDPAGGTLRLSIGANNGSTLQSISATVSAAALTGAANSVNQASGLLRGLSLTPTNNTLATTSGWGQQDLNSSGSFGDLNGDGDVDWFDPAGNLAISTVSGLSFSLWSIRAAGDVNGNGVDDVLLSLAPQGPAYKEVTSGQPSDLMSVLVDGSLFKVDTTSNSFRLDQLKTPLNPYNRSQLYDVASTATSDYAPSLQNWFDPILSFTPGSLTAASTANGFNPDSAESYTAPAVAISPEGETLLVFSGHSRSSSGSGLWIAYKQSDGSWTQSQLSVGSDATALSPSAVFYQGKLTVAYTDVNGDLHVAWCEGSPQQASSATWTSYQVITSADESSQWNPTLVAEAGRLALYFPSNASKTMQQTVRYLYSTDPFDATKYGNWGGTSSTTGEGYSGISGTISVSGSQPTVTSPIAATTFQGRTVLAFRSYATGVGSNAQNGNILLLTQVASAATAADPSTSLSWVQTDTEQNNSNGVGLASDQALLYLTSTNYPNFNTGNPAPVIWSLAPADSGNGTWSLGSQETVNGPGFPAYFYFGNNPLYGLPSATVLNPYLDNGKLMATWAGGNGSNVGNTFTIQVADLNATIGTPTQQSLAGYSLDGKIDINGDGFRDVLISDPSDPSESVDNQYALFGGDYLNIASQVGTSGNDVLLGTSLADVIYSLQGADRVISGGGADVIYTGAGDDQIAISNNAFIRIDAGPGFDTLQLQGLANQAYDFRLSIPIYFAGTKLCDIELINSINYGANTLSFDAAAINAINPDRMLFITPDSQDSIVLSSEFQRNSAFDITYAGSLWSAYAAGIQSTPAESSPALLYLLNPNGASASNWLNQHVLISSVSLAAPASPNSASTGPTVGLSSLGDATLPTARALISDMPFGDGLSLLTYRSNPSTAEARFAIERSDASVRQLVAYASSAINSSAEPGRDYDPIAGLLVLEVGELHKEITVPMRSDSLDRLGTAFLSLSVEELDGLSAAIQRPLHLVLSLDGSAADGAALPPTVSALSLTPSGTDQSAVLTFRADTNVSSGGTSLLNFSIRERSAADSIDTLRSYQAQILDENASLNDQASLHLANRIGQYRDRDQLVNQQVGARLELFLIPDTLPPTVQSVASSSANGLYGTGSTIAIRVSFSEDVTVDSSTGIPSLLLNTGLNPRSAVYASGSGTNTLTFLYTVQSGDSATHLDYSSINALMLQGGTIQDAAGNQADLTLPIPGAAGSLGANSILLIDGVAPVVKSITSANADGNYGLGALLTLVAHFSEPVLVNTSAGVPTLQLETGSNDRLATYLAGSGTDALTFTYTVQLGDSSADLDITSSTALAANGATLLDAAGNPADLKLPQPGAPGSLAANAALGVSGVIPQSLSINTATAVINEGATLAVTISSGVLAAGASVYSQFSGTGITAGDFSPAGLSGVINLGSDRRAAFSRSIALDSLSEGDEQLSLEFFADSAHTLSLGRTLFTIKDVVPLPVSGATDGRDLLIGTAADEILNGVPAVSALNGRNSYDTLTGNGGNDLFILGTPTAVFYDDGIATNAGASDLAAITDFSAGDRIQLKGAAADYRLASGRVSAASGVMVYRLNPATGTLPGATDELIGFVKGLTLTSLSLNSSSQFLFV